MLVISGANLIFFRKISEDNWEEHDSDTWLVGWFKPTNQNGSLLEAGCIFMVANDCLNTQHWVTKSFFFIENEIVWGAFGQSFKSKILLWWR
jgi:hypothetical protein